MTQNSQPSSQTVLITGSNGYIGAQIVSHALERGYNVRAAARSESSLATLRSKLSVDGATSERLSTAIIPDITKPESYADSLSGVTAIIHAASPFILQPKDNVKDVLEPAVNGSLAILEAAKRYAPSVHRVVNVSSFAAILDLGKGYRPGYTYTEKDWNPETWDEAAKDSNGASVYCASKSLAERAMWDWVESNKGTISFDLVSICPPWVFGPSVGRFAESRLSESQAKLKELIDAESVFPIDFAAFVDVRDLARALLAAVETPEAGGQRFLTGQHFDWQSAADAIRAALPEVKDRIPKGTPGAGLTEDVYAVDGSKAARVLGLEYTPLEVTLPDATKQILSIAS
ncbi:NAD dependent epimerase/dehydratase [Sodiomyces alkalinus F11]|uniref:NAD dependent epimerase/dehydratase n=1 Tax=Sodiomyces alkalinus (strain CBS 110278 / VKM F-3762 / F11) TaxID=1314773 RepID=A0A3N2PRU7_SODAK|nr:NAD dependent epimerase/dehydratase [Sodiomyces alkalinus F11]ROT37227.1 NAD dependent epimerase/dehydratase [Sodiomyces alkalinus F11]